nr:rRNA adenine N-6-methyltransferase family protein [Auraticoccus cholistanensis]
MLTAQSAPWFRFELHARVAAHHFSPRPGVDAGLLRVVRRDRPLVPAAERRRYEDFVRRVFTGRGRGMAQVLDRLPERRAGVAGLLSAARVPPGALPRDLGPEQWASLWAGLSGSRLSGRHRDGPDRTRRRGRPAGSGPGRRASSAAG